MKLLFVLGVTLLAGVTLSSALQCYTCIYHEGADKHDGDCDDDGYEDKKETCPTPVPVTPGPSTPSPAPSTSTAAPSTSTPAPSTSTAAPSTSTPAPSTSTAASTTTEAGQENRALYEADIMADAAPFCVKYIGKKDDKKVVIRECSPPGNSEALEKDACGDNTEYLSFNFGGLYENGTVCACKGNLCNSSSMVTMAPFLVGLIGLLLHQTLS